MVVKCIGARKCQGLTNGKKYKVIGETKNTYVVRKDNGCKCSFNKRNFVKCNFIWNLFVD